MMLIIHNHIYLKQILTDENFSFQIVYQNEL